MASHRSRSPLPAPPRRRVFSFLLLLALPVSLAPAPGTQQPTPTAADRGGRAVQDPTQRAALVALAQELEVRRAELEAARAELRDAADKPAQLEKVRDLEAQVRELGGKFGSLVVGLDVQELDAPASDSFDLKVELERLIQPLVQQLKDATAAPREIEDMRSRQQAYGEQIAIGRRALERARAAQTAATGDDEETRLLRGEIERVRQTWETRVRSAEQERTVLRAQLDNRLAERTSLVDSAGQVLDTFFRTRGLNLLLAIAAFLAVFLSLRFVHRRVQRLSKVREERRFPARLLDVMLHALVLVAAIAATLVTLYAVSDWLLLAIVLVFLFGAGWAAMRTAPQYLEQMRMMLNLGSVREGERIVYDGLPWRVEALKIYSLLKNPELQGGTLRVPLRELAGHRSRRMHPNEPWFPCRVGDFVQLADGTRGPVLAQTPEFVVLRHLGSERTFATAAFLEQTPRNLSRGFLVDVVFGIDYGHQGQATADIPAQMRARLQQELPAVVDGRLIKSITVEFREAGSSSLDLLALVDLDGAAAAQYFQVQRAVWRILTDACTRNGWVIPFPQLTVHQAAG